MTDARLTAPAAVLDGGPLPTGGGVLRAARRRIEDGGISVVTLDMFDTLVWRTVPRPTDAFVLLAHRLHGAGMLDPDLPPVAFRRLRIEAERRARQVRDRRGDGVEVTLEEIWEQIPGHLLRAGRPDAAAEEVALEIAVTRPDLDVVDLAVVAAGRGCRLAVVSNTYLSAGHLARMLARPRLDVLRTARLFASSAYGLSKANGLWKIVLDELDVAPERVLHVGDERTSDVDVPGELGIHTVHYPRLRPSIGVVLERERTLVGDRPPPHAHAVHPRRGDYGLTSLRAKVGGRPTAGIAADQATAWRYGATVLGPVLTGFADWVQREAEGLGVPVVRCMMREGEFLADLVNRAMRTRRHPVAATPVWLSRAVTAKAIVTVADVPELQALLERRHVPTVGEYLRNLGLGLGEVPELRTSTAIRMDQHELNAHVIGTLADSDHLRARIVAEATACRHRLVGYLRPLLDGDGDTTLLADLGWGGTIQWQLQRALALAGIEHRLVGAYLATNSTTAPRILQGLEVRGYLANLGEPFDAMEQIGRSPEIVEQACLATCGSLVDFTPDGQPVLDDSLPPPAQVASKLAVQDGVRAFQREWLRYGMALDDWQPFDGGERAHLLEILRRSVSHPTAEEARTFGAWTHDDNFGVNRREEVTTPRLGAYVPYLSATDLADLSINESYWPLGLAAQYDPGLAAAAQTILTGQMRPEDLEAGRQPARIDISVDIGHGWQSGQHTPLRINRNGLSFAGFDVRAPGIRRVRLDPCDRAAVFRIDWIELRLLVTGVEQGDWIRIEGAEDLGSLQYPGGRWLYDGLVVGDGDHCEVDIPLDRWVDPGADVYGVEVAVAMAVMPLPPGGVPLRREDFDTSPTVAVTPPATADTSSLRWILRRVRAEVADGGMGGIARGAVRFARRRLR